MKKFIIDRSTWRCGGDALIQAATQKKIIGPNIVGLGDTALLNSEGFMCCLGQIAIQQGALPDEIQGVATPEELEEEINRLSFLKEQERWDFNLQKEVVTMIPTNTPLSDQAMQINDDNKISLEEREKLLIELFKSEDLELEFINEPVIPA